MTKEVLLTIKGLQRYAAQEPVETVTESEAEYFFKGQSHYVVFEEETEGFTEKTKSMLKIRENCVELTRKGLVESHMTFEPDKLYMTAYRTPFGVIMLGIKTKKLSIKHTISEIVIEAEYALESNDEHMADCNIGITIRERQ